MQGRASKKIAKIPQPDYCLHVPTLVSQSAGGGQIFKGCLAVFTKILVATVQDDIITILAEWALFFSPQT